MSSPASSSRIAIIAWTLAGLLSAGLGVYCLRLAPEQPPARPGVAVPAAVPAAPAATPLAAPLRRTREQATLALMALPELKAWSARIEQHSAGKAHGAVVEYDPTPRSAGGKRYWQLSFVENSANTVQRWESFLVSISDAEILVEDPASAELLSLERWRTESHPMERAPGN